MNGLRIVDIPADRLEGDAVATFFFADERPVRGPAALIDWRLNGVLTDLLLQGRVTGAPGESILVVGNGKMPISWALFAGGGDWRGLDRGAYGRLVGELLETCRHAGFRRIALCLSPLEGMEIRDMERLVAGAVDSERAADCLISIVPRPEARFLLHQS